MSLKKLLRLRHTLAFRLALWYAAIFTLSSLTAFVMVYLLIAGIIGESTDEDLREDVLELAELLKAEGIEALQEEIKLEVESDGADSVFYRVLTPDGADVWSTDMSFWQDVKVDGEALQLLGKQAAPILRTLQLPDHAHETRIIYARIGSDHILQIGQSLEDDEEFLEIFRNIFSMTLAVLMLAATLIGWFMARRALRGVEDVTRIATEISKGTLDKRVPVHPRGDEVDQLADAFNRMLDRIHTLIREMREITDNIAHDMRNPITRIRGTAEMALTSPTSAYEYETMAANTIEECDRLLGMINTMLDIAEAEAGLDKMSLARVDMAAVVRDACELFEPLSEDRNILLVATLPDNSPVEGDYQRLQRMVANLLDNALKYTEARGKVTVLLNGDKEKVVVSVADTGRGIGEGDLPHIFNRFFRCDQSRSEPGNGLGLSLARAIATAHGGNITVSSTPGQGSIFTVTLPRTPH